ncbi:MAG: HIT domain-containing protein [Patescibacteria group bacterium]|mgnify:CR=1 FL=1
MLYKDFLKNLTICPFCSDQNRIISENNTAYLTYALAPYHKHHLLVIPKRHLEIISEINSAENQEIDSLVSTGLGILKKLNYNNISVLIREGNDVSKSIPHLHFHIIPDIRLGDLDHYGQERKVLSVNEVEELVSELKKLL